MTLASTAIDQVTIDPTPVKKTVLSYLPTDSAIFFTSDEDRILLKKQKEHYRPVLRWLKRAFDVEVKTGHSTFVGRIQHNEKDVAKMTALIDSIAAECPFALTCLQCATMECKSVILALAFMCEAVSLDQVRAASRLEEECQIEWWGAVEGGHDMDRLNNAVSLSSVGVFMGLLGRPRIFFPTKSRHEQK
jgi:ATP synthase F1 complex assembly factor 2